MQQQTVNAGVGERTDTVTSADGTMIGYRQLGSGPGLVIIHGSLADSRRYLRLAEALADRFTLYIPDRRGRGLSGPAGADYGIAKETEDLSALLRKTGARMVFGHSAGAAIALESALTLPIEKLMLYEPAVSINGSFPMAWVPAFERAVSKNQSAKAMGIFLKGLRLNWISDLPLWSLTLFARLLLSGKDGQELAALLPTAVRDLHIAQQLDPNVARHRNVAADTLLLGGSKSPAYLRDVLPILAQTIPHATLRMLAGLDHNAPDINAPTLIADALKEFLAPQESEQGVTMKP